MAVRADDDPESARSLAHGNALYGRIAHSWRKDLAYVRDHKRQMHRSASFETFDHSVQPCLSLSVGQALFAPEAWYRAIYLHEEPVGFVMLYDESLRVPAGYAGSELERRQAVLKQNHDWLQRPSPLAGTAGSADTPIAASGQLGDPAEGPLSGSAANSQSPPRTGTDHRPLLERAHIGCVAERPRLH